MRKPLQFAKSRFHTTNPRWSLEFSNLSHGKPDPYVYPFPLTIIALSPNLMTTKKGSGHMHTFTQTDLDKARLARKSATPKSTFASAIKNFCLHCFGQLPTNCGGHSLMSGVTCPFYHLRSNKLRLASTKTKLKSAIKLMCNQCTNNHPSICLSPPCPLYQFIPSHQKLPKITDFQERV